ncbi:hypothetical protein V5O48_015541 [Marasmius crinis-equi]|uniref:Uncharacterized protein n=1 Tax=Marasmius crinis-equi TaxID=585013 RepID=A0ABR3EU82_9AGAR
MLRRSKMAPLDVAWRAWGALEEDRSIQDIANHISRITRLKLAAPVNWPQPEGVMGQAVSRLTNTAPLLVSLHLDGIWNDVQPSRLALPPSFLGEHTPRLTELVLEGPFISWDSPLFRNNLTILKVRHFGNSSAYLPDCDELIAVLGWIPNLEELELRNAVPQRPPVRTRRMTASLQRLRSFVLTGQTALNMAYLMERISFPPQAHLRLLLEDIDLTFDSLSESGAHITSSLQKVFSKADPNLFTSLVVDDGQILARGCACPDAAKCSFLDCPSTFTQCRLLFTGDFGPLSGAIVREIVDESLPIAGIRSLKLVSEVDPSTGNCWIPAGGFALLQNLATVTISRPNAREFVEVFSRTNGETMSFPVLRVMQMDGVTFDNALFDVFRRGLQMRVEKDVRIRSLTLRCCTVKEKRLRQLQHLILNIKCWSL